MKPDKGIKVVSIIFIIFGMLTIIVGSIIFANFVNFKRGAIKTQATITDIQSYRNLKNNRRYTVYVEFDVEGVTYRGELNYHSSRMYVGATTTIYYDINNPNHFRSGFDIFGVILILPGVIFFIIGFAIFAYIKMKQKKKKTLLENGTPIYADFQEVRRNWCFRYNGKNPYQIICKSDNLEISEYVSENIWCNPETIIKERNITSFPVYLDPENPKKYYLSTEEIDKYIQLK